MRVGLANPPKRPKVNNKAHIKHEADKKAKTTASGRPSPARASIPIKDAPGNVKVGSEAMDCDSKLPNLSRNEGGTNARKKPKPQQRRSQPRSATNDGPAEQEGGDGFLSGAAAFVNLLARGGEVPDSPAFRVPDPVNGRSAVFVSRRSNGAV